MMHLYFSQAHYFTLANQEIFLVFPKSVVIYLLPSQFGLNFLFFSSEYPCPVCVGVCVRYVCTCVGVFAVHLCRRIWACDMCLSVCTTDDVCRGVCTCVGVCVRVFMYICNLSVCGTHLSGPSVIEREGPPITHVH